MISRVMWLIKGNHRHLKAEVLSEYLDGRLEGAALARVERSLAECSACREDLDSLQATVAALRRLPVEAPARDFVMAAPPFRPARPRPTPLARASMWAYAGAASVAALVLTVLASADATGLLAPSQPGFDEASTAAFDVPVSMEDYQSDDAVVPAETFDDSIAMTDEEAATTVQLITAEPVAEMELAEAIDESMAMADEGAAASEPAATAEPMAAEEPSVAFDDPEVMADGDDAGAATLETDAAMPAMDDAGAMAYDDAAAVDSLDTDDAMAMESEAAVAAEDAMLEDASADDAIIRSQTPEELEPVIQAASEAITEAPAPTAVVQVTEADGDAMAVAEDAPAPMETPGEPADAQAEEERAAPSPQLAAAAPTPEPAEAQSVETAVEEGQTPEEPASDLDPGPQEPGTALYWRILQGIAGALALLFLAAFAVKWRTCRAGRVSRR